MVCLQITISLLYIYKINVPPQLINIGSVITTIGLAILVVAGTYLNTQVLDYFLDIREVCFGAASVFRFLSQLYVCNSTL